MAQDDELLRAVRRGHPDPVLPGDLIGGLLDIAVGGLGLLGIDHVDVVVFGHRARVALDLVGVKDHDDHAFAEALVVGQDVQQQLPGGVQTALSRRLQLVPGVDDVVAVHQQVFRPPVLAADVVLPLVQAGAGGFGLGAEGLPLHLAVGPLVDGLELFVVGQGA